MRVISTLPLRLLKEELDRKLGILLTLSDVTNANDDKRMVDMNSMITICSFLLLQHLSEIAMVGVEAVRTLFVIRSMNRERCRLHEAFKTSRREALCAYI